MNPDGVKFESIFDDINHLKAEKCMLEERLKTVRLERMRKEAAIADLSHKRVNMANMLSRKRQSLETLQHRVTQQRIKLNGLREDVTKKAEAVKHHHAEVGFSNRRQLKPTGNIKNA